MRVIFHDNKTSDLSETKVIFIMEVDIIIVIILIFISTEKVSVKIAIVVGSVHGGGG